MLQRLVYFTCYHQTPLMDSMILLVLAVVKYLSVTVVPGQWTDGLKEVTKHIYTSNAFDNFWIVNNTPIDSAENNGCIKFIDKESAISRDECE